MHQGCDELTNRFSSVDVDDEARGLVATQDLILRCRRTRIRGISDCGRMQMNIF